MNTSKNQIELLLKNFRDQRKQLGISQKTLEDRLVIGPGWIQSIESNDVSISLEMLFALLSESGIDISQITKNIGYNNKQKIPRNVYTEKKGDSLIINFKYGKFNAKYLLENAEEHQFNEVIKTLRDNLAELSPFHSKNSDSIKTKSVTDAFCKATSYWPDANPSDLWWFVIYRAYLDPFNHPSSYSRLSHEQSWKRTAGWALEEILVIYYAKHLKKVGINLFIAPKNKRLPLLLQAKVSHKLEADKADIFLTGDINGKERFFGVVHVKASFAERRTDDVPMSKALVDAGYTSPLWTMDCKSTPSERPINKGELGLTKSKNLRDTRSAKRKDIEDDGYFSACFSYNKNTLQTPQSQLSKSRIYVMDFTSPENDLFYTYICSEWNRFKSSKLA